MSRVSNVFAFITLSLVTGSTVLAGNLREELIQAYPVTLLDDNGIKVERPGTVLAVQQPGIQADSKRLSPFQNKYENGKVSLKGIWSLVPNDLAQSVALAVRERVYLLRLDVRDDSIVMLVQTCGDCNPAAVDPVHKPHWASIEFKFVRGYLNSTDLAHIEGAIGALLAPAYSVPARITATAPTLARGGDTTANPPAEAMPVLVAPPPLETTAPAPPTLSQQATPVLVAPPPIETTAPAPPTLSQPNQQAQEIRPSAQADIEPGWSREKVDALLGRPTSVEKSGSGEVCVYGRTTVTFNKKGLVAGVVAER